MTARDAATTEDAMTPQPEETPVMQHVEVRAQMEPKGAVGVKDMLFDDVRRLTVNGSGGPVKDCENAFVASLYLMRDEAVTVANALLPESMIAVDRADIDRLIQGFGAWTHRHTSGENQAERLALVERMSAALTK